MHVAAFIESEDQSAVKRRSVINASGVAEVMVEEQKRTRGAVKAANLAKLADLTKRLAERMDPAGKSRAGKGPPKTNSCFAQGGHARTERERDHLHILDFGVGLFDAADDG